MDLVKGSIKTLLSQVLGLALTFVTSIVLARMLGPSNNGKYAVITLIPTLLQLIGALGIPSAIVYYGSKAEYPLPTLVATSLTMSLLAGGGVILLFALASLTKPYQTFVVEKNLNPVLVWVAVTSVPPYLIFQCMRQVLRSQEKINAFNIVMVFQVGAMLACIWLVLILVRSELDGAVLGYLLGAVSATVLASWVTNRLTPLRLGLDMSLVKKMTSFGFRIYIGTIFQFLNYRLDLLIVTAIAGATEAGYYVVAVALAERLWDLPNAVGVVLQPRVTMVSEQQAVGLTAAFTRTVLMVVFVLALLLTLFSGLAVRVLFGADYDPALRPLLLLLPGAVAFSVAKLLAAHLAARGYPQIPSTAAMIGLLINVPLNLLLVPRWGIAGSAFASTVMYFVVTIIVACWFVTRFNVRVKDLLLIESRDIATYWTIYTAWSAHLPKVLGKR